MILKASSMSQFKLFQTLPFQSSCTSYLKIPIQEIKQKHSSAAKKELAELTEVTDVYP